MHSVQLFLLLAILVSTAVATPIRETSHLRIARAKSRYEARQSQQDLTQPVTFQTVTTTQTQTGTITQRCNVTLTPITGSDGQTSIRQEKECKFEVNPDNSSASPSNGNNNGSESTTSTAETTTQTQASQTETVSSSTTTAITSSTASATAVPAISEIGVTTIPASETGTPPASSTTTSATGSTPPVVSVIGTGQIPSSAAGTPSPASTAAPSDTSLVTSVTTLSNGSVSTSTSTPSAAAAQEAAATTPGKKLEVLPIGLGVFAGVSVIALIVVGLVTYERTKYRKAFRQRKLAEAGANMGYGGMAERT